MWMAFSHVFQPHCHSGAVAVGSGFSLSHTLRFTLASEGGRLWIQTCFFCFLIRFLDSNLPPNPKVPCSNSLCNEVKASWTWMVKPFRHWYVFWRLLPANVLVYWLSCVFDLLSLCVCERSVCVCACASVRLAVTVIAVWFGVFPSLRCFLSFFFFGVIIIHRLPNSHWRSFQRVDTTHTLHFS